MELTFSHKYIKNTSTCVMILTEHLMNAGRRSQTSKRTRKSPRNRGGQEEKKKEREREKEIRMGPVPLEGSCERGKVSTYWEVPSLVGRSARQRGSFRASEESTKSRCGG